MKIHCHILSAPITFFFIFSFSFTNTLLKAGNYTWNGSTDSHWAKPANWTPSGVPVVNDTVTINTANNNIALDSNLTVYRFIMQNDSIDLGGFTLIATGSSSFSGGFITNGTLDLRGSNALFAGTTINASVMASCNSANFNGSVFSQPVVVDITGSNANTSNGGNTFNSTLTVSNSSGAAVVFANANRDIYNGNVTIFDTLSKTILFGKSDTSFFNGNIYINSKGAGIAFGNTSGYVKLATAKTITVGTREFSSGTLLLNNFIQDGSTAQSITLTGSAILSCIAADFGADITLTAPNILVKNSIFSGKSIFNRSSSVSNSWEGGNTFYGVYRFTNTGNGSIFMQTSNGDTFADSVIINGGNAKYYAATAEQSILYNNLYFTGGYVDFSQGTGSIACLGNASQVISGPSNLSFKNLVIDKSNNDLTLQAPITINNNLDLVHGKIITDTTHLLTFAHGSSWSHGSDSSFVSGPVKKTGNAAFSFPVGKVSQFNPVAISAPANSTDAFVAEYFNAAQTAGDSLADSIKYIYDCFYWQLKQTAGSSNVYVTLGWDTGYCALYDSSLLRIAKWDGAKWADLGRGTFTGSTSGTITSAIASLQNYFLALANPVLVAVASLSSNSRNVVDFYGVNGKNVFRNKEHDWQFTYDGGAPNDKLTENYKGLYPGVIRFNAGGPGNYFDWRKGWFFDDAHLLKYNQYLRDNYYAYSSVFEPDYIDFDVRLLQFKNALNFTGAIPIFEFNISSSDIDYQLALLLEAKRLNIPVKYVELGTELYLSNNGINVAAFPSGTEYADKTYEWTRRIKEALGEDIKVGVCVANNDAGDPRKDLWNEKLIGRLVTLEDNNPGELGPDAMIIHQYIHDLVPYSFPGGVIADFDKMFTTPYKRITSSTLSETCLFEDEILEIETLAPARNYEIWLTEYGMDERKWKIHGSWAGGLFTALQTMLYLEKESITMAVQFTQWSSSIWGDIFTDEDAFLNEGDEEETNHQFVFNDINDPNFKNAAVDEYSALGHAMKHIGKAMKNSKIAKKINFIQKPIIGSSVNANGPFNFYGLYGWWFSDDVTPANAAKEQLVLVNVTDKPLTIVLGGITNTTWTNYDITYGKAENFVLGNYLSSNAIECMDGDGNTSIGHPPISLTPLSNYVNLPIGSFGHYPITIPPYAIVRVYQCKVPALTVTASADKICSGEPVTLNLVTPLEDTWTLQWDDGSTLAYRTVTPSNTSGCTATAAVYTVTVTDNATCTATAATASANVTVSVMPAVDITITANPTGTQCPGTSITLTASIPGGQCSNNVNYVWITGDGDGILQHLPSNNSQIIVNPKITTEYIAYGLYNFISPDMQCAVANSVTLTVEPPPLSLPEDNIICNSTPEIYIELPQYDMTNGDYQLDWEINDLTNPNLIYSNSTTSSNILNYTFSSTDRTLYSVDLTVTHIPSACSVHQQMLVRSVNCCSENSNVISSSQNTTSFINQVTQFNGYTYSRDVDVHVITANSGAAPVALNGKIKLDENVRLVSCEFEMGEAAQIEILAHSSLNIIATTLNACTDYLWQGIKVNGSANFSASFDLTYTKRNEINDAQYGVYALNQSDINLEHTDFNDNFVGLTVPDFQQPGSAVYLTLHALNFNNPNTLKLPYIGQLLPSSTKTYAGMELHQVAVNLDFTGDGSTNAIAYNKIVFGGLSNGLLAYNCALNIGNCTFNNIQRLPAYDAYVNISGSDNGSGIYMEDYLTSLPKTIRPAVGAKVKFENCRTGITVNQASADIFETEMEEVRTGIKLENATSLTTIHTGNNNISCRKFGIWCQLTDDARLITINNNQVTVDDPGNPTAQQYAILVSEINQASPLIPHIDIKQNTINVYDATNGISIQGSNGVLVHQHKLYAPENYTINLHSYASTQNQTGIEVLGSNNITIEENKVMGDDASSTSIQRGFETNNSEMVVINCNESDETFYGFSFVSSCLAADFLGNDMYDHYVGLNLAIDAIMDVQQHKGNQWLGSYGLVISTNQIGARHQSTNPSFYQQSEFFHNQISHNAIFPYPEPTLWFSYNPSGSSAECDPQSVSSNQLFNRLDSIIVADSIEVFPFKQAINWQADNYIYNKLLYNESLISDSYIEDFVNEMDEENIGSFRKLRDTLNFYNKFNSEQIASLNTIDSLIQVMLSQKHVNDSLLDTLTYVSDSLALVENSRILISQIAVLLKENTVIMHLVDSLLAVKTDELIAFNEALSSGKIYEQNQINVNAIYLKTVAKNSFAFTNGQADSLYNIAIQCPSAGGKAVIYARNLYRLINDTIVFDNVACDSLELRMAQKKTNLGDIIIFPNPSNLFFDALIGLNENESYNYSLIDRTGKVCASSKDVKKYSIRINTEEMSEGVYVFSVMKSNGNFINKKVVIIR